MVTGKSGRGEDDVRTDCTEDVVLKLRLHSDDKCDNARISDIYFEYDRAIIHAFGLRRFFHTDYFPTFI